MPGINKGLPSRTIIPFYGLVVLSPTKVPPFLWQSTRIRVAKRTPVFRVLGILEHNRKANCMNAHPPCAVPAYFINTIYCINCSLHVTAAELIPEDIQAYLFVRIIEGIDSRCNTFHGAAVAERFPGAQDDSQLPSGGRECRGSTSPISGEQIISHIIHDLYALYLGIHLQCFPDLFVHQLPRIPLHAAGGVNDKNDVFTVYRNAAHRAVGLTGLFSRRCISAVSSC